MGAVLSADRRTRLHEAVPRHDDTRAAVARIARAGARRELREALRLEGELLRRVDHPNVAKGYEVGEQDSVGAYLIRERVDGVDLRDALRRSGPYSPERARDVALSLAKALRALDRAGSTACLEPEDVWIEDGTGRLVVVSAMPTDATLRMRNRASAQLVADVVIGCLRGRLPGEPHARARARVEVVQARRTGDGPDDVPPELGEIVEICVGRGADADVPSPSDLARRLEGIQLAPGGKDEDLGAERRARAAELRDMLAVSEELGVAPREEVDAALALPDLLERAESEPGAVQCSELDGSLRRARESLGGALARAVEERAEALEAEWAGLETQGRALVEAEAPEEFSHELRVAREESDGARFAEAQRALARARARLESARDVARSAAMQRARDGVDRLARRLDALEGASPGTPVDPALEPLRVRADVQVLVDEGRFAEALERVDAAVAEVERQSTEREASALRATVRHLAERVVTLRRNEGAGSDATLLDGVERTLSDAVALLGRGDLDGARVASEEAEKSLRRLDWERELAATEPGAVDGIREIDELRQAVAARARGERGRGSRSELLRRLESLERATHGAWTDAIARLRGIVDRSAWDLLGRALGDLREQILAAAASAGGVEFHPSPELAEVLRILAEAERDAPTPSASAAARLASIRERGEEMLARLDADRAREERPDLVDELVEHCAAAADAERRGEHDRAARELEAANRVLAELLGATGAVPPTPGPERPVVAVGSEPAAVGDRPGSGAAPVATVSERTRPGPAEVGGDADPAGDAGHTHGAQSRRTLPAWAQALATVDRRAWLGLTLLLVGVAWSTWPAAGWWTPPRVSGPSAGALVGDVVRVTLVPTGLFPHIAASAPAATSLPRARLPRELEVVVARPSSGEEPAVVWWADDRVIHRGSHTLSVARIPDVVWGGSDFVRVTVGDGMRPEQTRVWSLE